MKDWKELFLAQSNTIIIGKKGSGKTVLGWVLGRNISKHSGRKLCVFNHPRQEMLEKLPFEVENLANVEALYNVTDAVVIIDEAHEVFNVLEKKVNEQLKALLARSRQNNTCFIFICHNSYFINRSIFTFIDNKLIKEVNDKHWELERSYMKKLYEKEAHITGVENYYMDSEYVKGEFKLNKPSWWLEDLSFSYKRSTKVDLFEEIALQCAKIPKSAPKCAEVRQNPEKCAETSKSAPCEQKVHQDAPKCEQNGEFSAVSTEMTLQEQQIQQIKQSKEIGMPNINDSNNLITERRLNDK